MRKILECVLKESRGIKKIRNLMCLLIRLRGENQSIGKQEQPCQEERNKIKKILKILFTNITLTEDYKINIG